MPRLVPVDIITGFLGSGKTTLLQHVLQHGLNGQRVAVIVNDLAEYNIDGQILKGMNVDQMVKLTSGCVCCSGIYQLGLGLQEIVETADPSLILMETSGAAAPGLVMAELSNLGYQTDAVITVVDAKQFLRLLKAEPVVTEQVEEADFLVLDKLDLASAPQITKISNTLKKLNPRASVFETTFGRISADLLLATGMGRLRKSQGNGLSHPEGIEYFVYETEESMDLKRLSRFLTRLPGNFYRAKGFLKISGEAYPWLLNYTCGRYQLEPFPPFGVLSDKSFRTRLVFVGREVKIQQQDVTEALSRCALSAPRPSFLQRLLSR